MIESVDTVRNPSSCLLIVTNVCTLRCKMCWSWKCKPNPDELSIQQWKDFVVLLRNRFNSSIEIGITGGEPLLKEGILDLIKVCSENSFRTVLTTNAYLIDEEMARRVAESGLNLIFISLDSLNEQTHDFLRGVEGAYRRVMKAIDYLDKFRNGLEIGIQTLITNKNLDGLLELVEWINKDNRINTNYIQAINIPINSPTDSMWYKRDEFNFLWPQDIKKTHAVLDRLIEFKENKNKIPNSSSHLKYFKSYFENPQKVRRREGCPFGETSFNVSNHGDSYLCWEDEPLGNITVDDIDTLWFSERAEQIRRRMRSCRQSCPALINCNFEE